MLNKVNVYLVEVMGLPGREQTPHRFIALTNKTATSTLISINALEGIGYITITSWVLDVDSMAIADCELKNLNGKTSQIRVTVDGRIIVTVI